MLRQHDLDLTPRERDVLPLVVSGLLNKQAAAELGISEVTLQIHRRNVMQKMSASSLPTLADRGKTADPSHYSDAQEACEDAEHDVNGRDRR